MKPQLFELKEIFIIFFNRMNQSFQFYIDIIFTQQVEKLIPHPDSIDKTSILHL